MQSSQKFEKYQIELSKMYSVFFFWGFAGETLIKNSGRNPENLEIASEKILNNV